MEEAMGRLVQVVVPPRSEYLVTVRPQNQEVLVYNLETKQAPKIVKAEVELLLYSGFCHLKDSLLLAGGRKASKYYS